jgi:lysozyme
MLFTRGWGLLGGFAIIGLVACGTGAGPGEYVGSAGAAITSRAAAAAAVTKGVDVSHYDGTIDWTSVKAAGIAFAFAKATESTNDIDPDFATNWAGMKAAGVIRGAYHFFDSSVDPTSQATYCLATVGTLEAGDLPIVLDFEDLNGEAEATAVANAVTFLAAVTSSTGKTAILYMSSDFLSGTYPALEPYTLWVANYGVTTPGIPHEWTTWTFWQNSDTGTVSGISDATDLDEFNGTLAQLGSLTGGSASGSSGSSSSGSSGSSSGSGGGSSGSSSGSSSGVGTASGGGSSGGSSSGSTGASSGTSTASGSGGSATQGDAGPTPTTPSGDSAGAFPEPDGGAACAVAGGGPGGPGSGAWMALGALLLARRRRR